MKQLDLSEQCKKQLLMEEAQIFIKSTSVTRECEKENLTSNNNPTTTTNAITLTKLAEQNRGQQEHEADDEPMEIVETDRNRKIDLSVHEAVVNRATLSSQPERVDEDSRIVNSSLLIPSASQLSDSNLAKTKSLIAPTIPDESPILFDPRFYVRTSFETISQKTTLLVGEPEGRSEILSHGSLRSNVALNSIALSSSASSRSSQYYNYCLSEGEFDITLPSSQTTSSDIMTMKQSKEISRIETDTSLEKAFLHMQESLSLTPDDDIMMSPA